MPAGDTPLTRGPPAHRPSRWCRPACASHEAVPNRPNRTDDSACCGRSWSFHWRPGQRCCRIERTAHVQACDGRTYPRQRGRRRPEGASRTGSGTCQSPSGESEGCITRRCSRPATACHHSWPAITCDHLRRPLTASRRCGRLSDCPLQFPGNARAGRQRSRAARRPYRPFPGTPVNTSMKARLSIMGGGSAFSSTMICSLPSRLARCL